MQFCIEVVTVSVKKANGWPYETFIHSVNINLRKAMIFFMFELQMCLNFVQYKC